MTEPVQSDGDVVMGVVGGGDVGVADQVWVETVMRFGVSTPRASEDVEALVGRMGRSAREAIVATSRDSRLLGLLPRADAEAARRSRQTEEDR